MKDPHIVLALAAALVLLPAAVAPAAVKNWNGGSGNWSVPGNWTLAGVPALGDAVNIVNTDGVARTIALDVSTPSLGLTALDLTGPGSAAHTLSITSNNNITAAALSVGGYNGTVFTNGRGAVDQSAGTTTISPGVDLIMAWGSGSTGTYALSGGAIVANQGVWVGYAGIGRFNHSAGTHTINASAASGFIVGANTDALGVYNLSGAGALTVNANEYVGYSGVGVFNQTGGTNTVTGTGGLTLGWGAGSNGSYMISSGTLTANSKIEVGRLGIGTLTIQNNGSVFTDNLTLNNQSTINLNGGTLRFKTIGGTGGVSPSNFHFNAGTIQLAPLSSVFPNVNLSSDARVAALFGSPLTIPTGKGLTIEANASLTAPGGGSAILRVNGGRLTVDSYLQVGSDINAPQSLEITDGGVVVSLRGDIRGSNQGDAVTVSGSGSAWNVGDLLGIGLDLAAALNIQDEALVNVGGLMMIFDSGTVNLRGGTLRLNAYDRFSGGTFNFHAGTLELVGDRSIGSDVAIADILGAAPIITPGKELSVIGTATLLTSVTLDGGTFSVGQLAGASLLNIQRGTLNVANQAITIGPSGPLGDTLDLGHDTTINVTLGMTNQGLVTGDGEFGGSFHNAAAGELRAEAGESLTLTGAANTNLGRIYLQGGTADFHQNLTNNATGQILGRGTLMVGGGLTNNGHIALSSGITDVFGDVNNNTGVAARGITVSGNADVTFWDDVNNVGVSLFRVSAASSATFFGTFTGAGISGTGNVYFEADVTPGASPAAAQFGGNVFLGAASTLNMELGGMTPGAQYDQLLVSGALSLGGALEVSLINGFYPVAGQSFNLLDWGSLAGAFSALTLPSLTGLAWNTSQLYTTGVLTVVAAPGLAGDFNGNGIVDAADYVAWRKGLGTTYTQNDYNVWRTHFGQTLGGGTAESLHTVPEPTPSANLLMFVVAGSTFRMARFRNSLADR